MSQVVACQARNGNDSSRWECRCIFASLLPFDLEAMVRTWEARMAAGLMACVRARRDMLIMNGGLWRREEGGGVKEWRVGGWIFEE